MSNTIEETRAEAAWQAELERQGAELEEERFTGAWQRLTNALLTRTPLATQRARRARQRMARLR